MPCRRKLWRTDVTDTETLWNFVWTDFLIPNSLNLKSNKQNLFFIILTMNKIKPYLDRKEECIGVSLIKSHLYLEYAGI